MIKIAIVEDEKKESDNLKSLLTAYADKNGQIFTVDVFVNPVIFLENYKNGGYDVVFLDIEMPLMDGVELARRLRKTDGTVIIVFVTNMAQLAIEGYSVEALDFVVKPVKYARLNALMSRALNRLAVKKSETVDVRTANSLVRLDISYITYIEVAAHRLYFHTVDGTVHDSRGSLNEIEEVLPKDRFARCNKCYIVNLQFVKGVKGDEVLVGEDYLKISRPKKKDFLEKLVSFVR